MREIHPATFQNIAILNQTGKPAAAFRPFPTIAAKGFAVDLLHSFDDKLLQLQKKLFDALGMHGICLREDAEF
jgi:hypothetical protein